MQDVVCKGMDTPDATGSLSDCPGAVHCLLSGLACLQPHYTCPHSTGTVLSHGLQYYSTDWQPGYGQSKCQFSTKIYFLRDSNSGVPKELKIIVGKPNSPTLLLRSNFYSINKEGIPIDCIFLYLQFNIMFQMNFNGKSIVKQWQWSLVTLVERPSNCVCLILQFKHELM